MSSYIGRHADLYDLFYADKLYAEEAYFVHLCLEKFSKGNAHRLLELACGTGKHALEFNKLGYEVMAVDYSKDMLACARRKAFNPSLRLEFREQDIRALDIPERPFDAVICLFDSIGYVATNDSLIQVLKGIHRHLRHEGLFIFEFWHAGAMLRNFDPIRIRRWEQPSGEILRISETALDYVEQTGQVAYSVYELHNNGSYSCFKETQTNRYFLVQEMAGLLSTCSFQPLKWFAGFTEQEEITENTWHIVAVARRLEL